MNDPFDELSDELDRLRPVPLSETVQRRLRESIRQLETNSAKHRDSSMQSYRFKIVAIAAALVFAIGLIWYSSNVEPNAPLIASVQEDEDQSVAPPAKHDPMSPFAGEELEKLAEIAPQDSAGFIGDSVNTAAFGGRPVAEKDGQQEETLKTWKRSEIIANATRLAIGDKEELPLEGMQVNVRVDGFRARVMMDCWYFNKDDQQYEGTFQLRLPNGATPFFFAFGQNKYEVPNAKPNEFAFLTADTIRGLGPSLEQILVSRSESWEEPKVARIVPREKASYSYGEVVRRQIDPALAEWAGAGVFNCRVFPLEPQKLAHIVVGYDLDLLRAGDNLVYQLDLPEKVRTVVDLNVATPAGVVPKVTPDSKPVVGQERTHYRFSQPTDRRIELRLTAPQMALAGADPETGRHLAIKFRPDLPDQIQQSGSSHAVFLVDTSLSANPDQFNVWLKLLGTILEKNRDSLESFSVLFFDVQAHWWRKEFVANSPENVESLLQYAKTLSLEGATDIGSALRMASRPSWSEGQPRPDLFLLSDGAATWGERDLFAISETLKSGYTGPLFAYRTGYPGTDLNSLDHLTRESGGAVFSVVGESEVTAAATAHRSRAWRLEDVKIEGAKDLLLAGRPRFVFPGQELLLVGRGLDKDATANVVLSLERDGKREQIEVPVLLTVESELAPRAYGQVAVNQLEEFLTSTEKYSEAYARHFRITGQSCSLVMLETEEDYLEYGIKPQEDAFVVKSHLAGELVRKAIDELASSLGNPKASFLTWLGRLGKMPGVEFETPLALKTALEGLPVESFAVETTPLSVTDASWSAIPGTLQEKLAAKKLDYDELTTEAKRRLDASDSAAALRAISSLIENNPGDVVLARDVAFSASEWGMRDQSYSLYRRVADLRPYEPHTYLAIADCLAEMNKADLALAYYEVAINGNWGDRFPDFNRITTMEYLRFLRQIAEGKLKTNLFEFAEARLKTLSAGAPKRADLAVVIAWNTDRTDVDLHVVEPSGEECFYEHTKTKSGGNLSADVTQGYGPEMYMLPTAPTGTYRIRVKYFSSDRNRASARSKVFVTLYERWGTPEERVTHNVVTLTEGKEMHDVATAKVTK